MARWLAAALIATALGCAARQEPAPPPAPAPAADPVSVTVEEIAVDWKDPAKVAAAEMGPSEPGFVFCCGAGSYKMEIDCADMLKRCYERTGTGWAATYGRHCKRELGESCYLEECDARCQ